MSDWIEIISLQVEKAERASAEIFTALMATDLTAKAAVALHRHAEAGAVSVEELSAKMRRATVPNILMGATDDLLKAWDLMALEAGNRVREFRGLMPIEIPLELF